MIGKVALLLFGLGIGLVIITKNLIALLIPSLGIPIYFSYIAIKENVIPKSRVFDKEFLFATSFVVFVIVFVSLFIDPRWVVLLIGLVLPILFLLKDRQ
ncbi:hypothetical protein PFDSM3638_07390 [Pyrococcus furiosus DSM 3638]|uniref:Uncharacterized protein n=3 Tax=Pyrococcus furiosus TaxID=2261 RepID=A0A5C0XQ26_PYRFU|nr:hypothetical protein [Pyrococcus furiosus]AAL81598.1 hypothetical protein PF1474 [Pyrococcus furiosus DSM 3638]AFN04257.1 hypothetical protein PFC_06605 [Pyrococcus furiosus COM1]QEK79103.1 hypothetical protein PFDSM3638_07390 [Pyrococcus furiosus DSM 3638]